MKTINQNVLKSHPNRLCQILPSSTPLAIEFSAAQMAIIYEAEVVKKANINVMYSLYIVIYIMSGYPWR